IAAAAPDPIYAAIERSRKAERALDSLGENATNGERTTAIDEATDARWDLASTVATTPAGLTALTAFICEEEKDLGEAGPFFDSDESKVFAESLNQAVAGMAGLKPWEGVEYVTVEPAKPDPIYALIENHRRLYKAFGDAISARENLYGQDREDCPTWRAHDDAANAAGEASWQAEHALVMIGATTPQGWAALLRYEDEHRRAGGEFVDLPTDEKWRMGLMRRLAAFLDGKPEWPPIPQKRWPEYRSA